MASPGPLCFDRFEDILPNQSDPVKEQFRDKLTGILNSQGEILPAASSPLGKLWFLVNSKNSTIEEYQEVIQLDPALASRMFRVANSAAYGGKASNISEAIFHIGLRFIRELVFNAAVFAQFSNLQVPSEWELFWVRNIFIARLTERIAATYFPTDGSEYFAGLIHDVGWLFLATHFPDDFARLTASNQSFIEAEKEILPFSHADIAGVIAARSSLPLRTVNAIQYHHHPMKIVTKTLTVPCQDARFLATTLSICDKIANNYGMNLFDKSYLTMEEIRQTPEALWLNNLGNNCDLEVVAVEEWPKSKDIFNAFFE